MKPIFEYLKVEANGCHHYEDENGLHYETLEDFLQISVLGFCGCGDPEAVLKLFYDLLKLKEKWKDRWDEENAWTNYNEEKNKYLFENMEKVSWFFDYLLDKKEITTHGGNVSASWIDDDNFFDALKMWHAWYEKNREDEDE